MAQGVIERLCVYPIKGCRGIELERMVLDPIGPRHDRGWLIVRADGRFLTQRELPALATIETTLGPDGLGLEFGGARHVLPYDLPGEAIQVRIWRDDVQAWRQDAAIDAALSTHLGRPVQLVHFAPDAWRRCDPEVTPDFAHTSFTDGFPMLVTNVASLAALNDWLLESGATPVPMERFRPNIVIGGVQPWIEDAGGRIVLEDGPLELVSPCERCIVTTTDQTTGQRSGPQPITTLVKHHASPAGKPLFGWNAIAAVTAGQPWTLRRGDRVEVTAGD